MRLQHLPCPQRPGLCCIDIHGEYRQVSLLSSRGTRKVRGIHSRKHECLLPDTLRYIYRRARIFLLPDFSLKSLSSEKTSRGQMLMHAPQSMHSLSFTLMPCSRRCTVAPRLTIVSLTDWHWSSGTSISASPSEESMTARSTLIRTPVSLTTCAMIGPRPFLVKN